MDRPEPIRRFSSIVLQYGLRSKRIHACHSLYRKAAAYRVSTDKGDYFLKPFEGRKARLDRVYSRMVWLKEHNFHNMPKWLETGKGKHWVKNNGRLYYVSEWIQGSQLDGNAQEYERLGEILGRLHLISRGRRSVSSSFSMRKIKSFQQENQMFIIHLAAMRKKRQGIGNWFRKHGDQCIALADGAWSTLQQSDVLRVLRNEKPSLIHGDVTWPNVIVRSDCMYLVDWEFAGRGSSYYEVAKTLSNMTNYSVAIMNALLVGYERICPLTKEERLIIASFYRLPREAWIAIRQIRSGRRSSVFDGLKKLWSQRIEAVQWMDNWARQQQQEPQPQESQELVTAAAPNEEVIGIVDNP
ncbi:phosphotransferase [Paenibacillus ferrarius]|uniref:phosphotransferase n=1 Tax=Paenibacillus ferrarius TaxID=1469647 RepID=UPI00244C16DD|nr:phosphotransferase [Paenibacillus ferrarius]